MTGGIALQALIAGLSVGAVYALVAVGFTLVWSLTRVLAFAHGDVLVGGVLLAVLAVVGGTPVALSPGAGQSIGLVLLTVTFAVALSLLSYLVAVRPFLNRAHRADDLLGWVAGGVTFGLVVRTAVAFALPAAAYVVPDPLHLGSGAIALPGGGSVATRAFWVLALGLAIAAAADVFVSRSRVGRAIRSVADDPDAATLCGVPVERVVLFAFGIAGLLAGAAALLSTPAGTLAVDSGVTLGLDGAAAALLGGLGSPRGAVAGGLAVGVAQQLVAVAPHFGASWSELLPLAVLVAVLAVRPLPNRAVAE